MTEPLACKPPYQGTKSWVEEVIWGHRFYNDQSPWLVLLEFLALFQERTKADKALTEPPKDGKHEDIHYRLEWRLLMRQLIFNNPYLQTIKETEQHNKEQWRNWEKASKHLDVEKEVLNYWKGLFEGNDSFSGFHYVIDFLRKTSVQAQRKRRWSSKFLFPYGPNCLYEDLRIKAGGNISSDRRFLARGGELLYLMLNRSGGGETLARQISEKLLDPPKKNTWNRVATALLPPNELTPAPRSILPEKRIGYLPYADRPEYQQLAKTWRQLLSLNLPGATLLDPLMRLSGLHMLLYILNRANEEIGDRKNPKFVLEVAAPKKTDVRAVSLDNFDLNRRVTEKALRAHMFAVKKESEWKKACGKVGVRAVLDFMNERLRWQPANGTANQDPDEIFETMMEDVVKKHKAHFQKIHREWTKEIGLFEIGRGGTRPWYAPSDALLKALVLCLEKEREEYDRFLDVLHERFNLVIGEKIAEEEGIVPSKADRKAFIKNKKRLEQRLSALGLLKRLSDGCAYVENPAFPR
jgi:hypothetical protein